MTDRLPPNLLRLFQPRPPIEYLPPIDFAPHDRHLPVLTGVSDLMDPLKHHDPDYIPKETPLERRERLIAERIAKNEERIAKELETWDPHKNDDATSDPFRTLFVGRLSYNTTKDSLIQEFERYGPISKIKLVKNKETGLPRGYAFIEFQRESDMMAAVKSADGIKLDDRRIVVDVERARTVKGWRPRRLGGGLGHTRFGYKWANQDYPGRDLTGKPGGPSVPGAPRSNELAMRSNSSRSSGVTGGASRYNGSSHSGGNSSSHHYRGSNGPPPPPRRSSYASSRPISPPPPPPLDRHSSSRGPSSSGRNEYNGSSRGRSSSGYDRNDRGERMDRSDRGGDRSDNRSERGGGDRYTDRDRDREYRGERGGSDRYRDEYRRRDRSRSPPRRDSGRDRDYRRY